MLLILVIIFGSLLARSDAIQSVIDGSVKASANYDIKFQSDSVGDFSENSIRKSSSDRAQSKDLSFPPSISLSSFSRTTTSLEKGPVHKSVDRSDPRVTTGSIDRFTRRLSAKHNKADADKYSNISWAQMSKDSKSSMRNEVVKETLRKFAGIYSDKSKVKNLGIEKFVLVNVLQINLNQNENHNLKYLHLLQNWYCFSQRYGLQPVTYIVPSYDKSFEEQVQDFHSLGIQGNFLTYPNSLFWDLVSQKTTSVVGGPQRVSYAGTLPTFKHFGALVMVVPLLEVLELGYNPIYLDLDIAFVRDPIPHMIRGTADFVVSIEMRTCILPSVVEVAVHTNWLKAEPNTGVLLVRSTVKGIEFYRTWLSKIVQENINNDQKVLYFDQFDSKITFDCNENLDQYSNTLLKGYLQSNRSQYHQHCFLNDFLFQNGKVGFQCVKGQGGSLSDYVLGMKGQNFSELNTASNKMEATMAPVLIHGNYCENKIEEFRNLGLWLAPEKADGYDANVTMTCKPYDINQTNYHKTNWTSVIKRAEEDMAEVRSKFANNSLVRLFRKPTIYLVKEGILHPFPNAETIEAMGYTWGQINHLKAYNFIKFLSVAPEMPEIALPKKVGAAVKV